MPDDETVTYPGAHRPDRRRIVRSGGLDLAVYEWGPSDAPPILAAHGGFDFAGTFDVFGPLLVEGGWRLVSWDHRGHGDSQHAQLYSWDCDIRDAIAVLDSIGQEPIPLLGHSKGGSLMLQLAEACPWRCSALVNIDGLPSRSRMTDTADHERTRTMAADVAAWLDRRRHLVDKERRPGTIDELAKRRAVMNPRLSHEWLRYLVTIGARRDLDGWRWRIDPTLRMGGFGPWRPEWRLHQAANVAAPFLVLLGLQPEAMGWGTGPDDVKPWLPPGAQAMGFDDVGHFVHIEQPERTASIVLDFLAAELP